MNAPHTETKDYRPLLEVLAGFIEKGDVQGGNEYVVKNLKEFPEDVQGEILASLVTDALKNADAINKGTEQIQERAYAAIELLEQLKERLHRELKRE